MYFFSNIYSFIENYNFYISSYPNSINLLFTIKKSSFYTALCSFN
nr:MAG TPA: hypothetical protein [Caudoviricetes sp.]